MKDTSLLLARVPFPTNDDVLVPVGPVSYDDELKVFYYSGDVELRVLDSEFHNRELLNLCISTHHESPNDDDLASRGREGRISRICAFMSEYGLIAYGGYDSPEDIIQGETYYTRPIKTNSRQELISQRTFDTLTALDARHDGIATRVQRQHNYGRGFRPFIDELEAIAAIGITQRNVATLIRAAVGVIHNDHERNYDGDNTFSSLPLLQMRLGARWFDAFPNEFSVDTVGDAIEDVTEEIAEYFPALDLAPRGGIDAYQATPPAMVAAYVQLIDALTSKEGYRKCPECGTWFHYKRGSDGRSNTDGRGPRAKFCKPVCQRAYNHRIDNERQREKRRANKAAKPTENAS